MVAQSLPVIPPAPKVHAKDLPTWRHLLTAQRNSIGIVPDYAFAVPFARRTLLGVDVVLINDPEGIRHVMATNAANYVRPKMMPRVLRPLLGQGIFGRGHRVAPTATHAVASVYATQRGSVASAFHRRRPLLLAARNVETGEELSATEVRDQCATFIFGGFETTARLLFWVSYLLTLDVAEQERLRTEVAAF